MAARHDEVTLKEVQNGAVLSIVCMSFVAVVLYIFNNIALQSFAKTLLNYMITLWAGIYLVYTFIWLHEAGKLEKERILELKRKKRVKHGDKSALIDHLERYEDSIVLPSVFSDAVWDFEEESKTAILTFFPQGVSYKDKRKRSSNTIKRDTELQAYSDCIRCFSTVFKDEVITESVDRMRITIIERREKTLREKEREEEEEQAALYSDEIDLGEFYRHRVRADVDECRANVLAEIELNRDQFYQIPSESGPDFLHKMVLVSPNRKYSPQEIDSEEMNEKSAETQSKSGYVYILINPAMKGLVKIGKTSRSSEERATEISKGTGVPTDFHVAYEEFFTDHDAAEAIVHEKLDQYRVNTNREFFDIPLKEAIRTIREVADELEKDM